jgi:peptidoglycan/xylan/chitin deacetylase (PgdA/CDA1 family)
MTLRRLVKTAIAVASHRSAATRLAGPTPGSGRGPVVVGYHRVVEDFAAEAPHTVPAMLISVGMLERHLDWLGRRFRLISLDELASHLETGEPFDRPVAAVTFDDGYRDVYDYAFPLLRRKGIPAAVFVVTDLVGTSSVHIHDKLYLLLARAFARGRSTADAVVPPLLDLGVPPAKVETIRRAAPTATAVARVLLDELPQAVITAVIDRLQDAIDLDERALRGLDVLTWEMLAEMHAAGMTIGSHTRTHALLTNESGPKVLEEIAGSRLDLATRLGITVDHFAYPSGQYNGSIVAAAVAASGYRAAYTTCPHRDPTYPLLTVPRMMFWQTTGLDAFGRFCPAMMSCVVAGSFPFRVPCPQEHR